jgi:hypothetical protein
MSLLVSWASTPSRRRHQSLQQSSNRIASNHLPQLRSRSSRLAPRHSSKPGAAACCRTTAAMEEIPVPGVV